MTRPYRTTARHGYTGNDPQLMDNFDIPAHIWDAARIELGAWPSDQQVERRALQLLDDELSEGGPDYD